MGSYVNLSHNGPQQDKLSPPSRGAWRPPFSALPAASGLYDPRFEHDACGVGFVVDVTGARSRDIVDTALGALCNLDHRGASGAEVNTGDGAGILIQVPDAFLRGVTRFALPPAGEYGVGMAMLPADETGSAKARGVVEDLVEQQGLRVIGWRNVPTDDSMIGPTARAVMPSFWHCFIGDPAGSKGVDLDRKLFVLRKKTEHEACGNQEIYFPSLSSRTLVYKGMLTTPQLQEFFPDLSDRRRAQRRDQHIAGQPQLDAGADGADGDAADPGPGAGVPDHHRGLVGHDELRRVPGAAAPGRAVAGARRADDDPGGVGEPCDDVGAEAGVLPLPRVIDGAMGWPGVDRLYGPDGDRRGAGPERVAAEPILGD
jgi:hypothetical protein